MGYEDVESELRRHPKVSQCAVTKIRTGHRKDTLVAYVVTTGRVHPSEIKAFLSGARVRPSRVPQSVIPVDSLPRTREGAVDRDGLPLPVVPARSRGTKGPSDEPVSVAFPALTLVFGVAAFVLTDRFWPGSTDLSLVPQPWAGLFTGLYVAESLAFGLGIAVLFLGRERLSDPHRPGLTTAAHLSVVWLLAAWWPQDNFYRLAAKNDWATQAVLVYGFNVSLMIAAAIVVLFVTRE
ncbi:hypothetical protein GCM10022243_67620 [Saccharothrix violaceirubra]|uniref:AMP-binding enzyme C-terminal domain-containing protein n=1 Tax=Saccharothrix violaceirubra TaxID=413306 RepID=A0A7W7T2C1_9PSEU|nr:hypothetical protein [Saccharothrix violaceirubra]MBB4965288.1 hypothetical protein [Saccharothrix violaceirubra]